MQDDNTTLDTPAPSTTDNSSSAYGSTDAMTTTAPTDSPSTESVDEVSSPSSSPAPADTPATPVTSSGGGLQDIKSQALQQLQPLLDHLDQSPEDKFKAIMMMIQAQDNKDLIQDAYNAAQQITDEKVRAQALLDIISEVNYFTASQP